MSAHLRSFILISTSGLNAAAALFLSSSALAQEPGDKSKGSDRNQLECTAVDEPMRYANYWVGPSFDGLELTSVDRGCSPPRGGSAFGWDDVTYVYGECDSHGGCAPPIEIQTWPRELRNAELLDITGTATTVEGVPATRYGGSQLEIYHPGVTVVIFGDDRARVDRFARALIKGPAVLAELGAYGIVFPEDCMSDPHFCQGNMLGKIPSPTERIVVAVLLFSIGPVIAFVLRPRRVSAHESPSATPTR